MQKNESKKEYLASKMVLVIFGIIFGITGLGIIWMFSQDPKRAAFEIFPFVYIMLPILYILVRGKTFDLKEKKILRLLAERKKNDSAWDAAKMKRYARDEFLKIVQSEGYQSAYTKYAHFRELTDDGFTAYVGAVGKKTRFGFIGANLTFKKTSGGWQLIGRKEGTTVRNAVRITIVLVIIPIVILLGVFVWQRTQHGYVKGTMTYPAAGTPDDIDICAENLDTGEIYCKSNQKRDDMRDATVEYTLILKQGFYYIYSTAPSIWHGPKDYKAYYSEYVVCGGTAECTSHKPIVVEVKKGQTLENIDPIDWGA